MESYKINWKQVKVSNKKGAGKPVTYILDEIGQYDFGLNKDKGWKPEVWYGYNEKGELIYNKSADEEKSKV